MTSGMVRLYLFQPDYDAALDYAASAMDIEDPPVVIHTDEYKPDHDEKGEYVEK